MLQLARGLLDLYQVTGDPAHLEWAQELLDIVAVQFARPGGAWYTTPESGDIPLGRRVDLFDSGSPGGASVAVDALVTYGALTGHVEALDEARRQLDAQSGLLARAALEMAGWLDAALRLEGPLYDVVVVGGQSDEGTQALYLAAAEGLSPGVVITPLPATGSSAQLKSLAPALAGKTAPNGTPTAYVCQRGICKEPSVSPEKIRELTSGGWVR